MDTLLKHRIVGILNLGWRQHHLAEATGRSQAAVSKWASGEICTISFTDAKAIADLTGFQAEWIVSGTGEKYLPGGPTPAPCKSRKAKHYQTSGDSKPLSPISPAVRTPGLDWQTLVTQVEMHDSNLAALLKSYQLGSAQAQLAMANMAKVFALASPQQLPNLLQALWQSAGNTLLGRDAFMPTLELLPQEATMLAVLRAASPQLRLSLLDTILEQNHGFQLEDVQSFDSETGQALTPIELRLLAAVRALDTAAKTTLFQVLQSEAQELGVEAEARLQPFMPINTQRVSLG